MQIFTHYAVCGIRQDFRYIVKQNTVVYNSKNLSKFYMKKYMHYTEISIQTGMSKENEIVQFLFPISNWAPPHEKLSIPCIQLGNYEQL